MFIVKAIFLALLLLIPVPSWAICTTTQFNPFTGKLDFCETGGGGSGAAALTGMSDIVQPVSYTAGNMLVANGTKFASVAITGDISVTSAGVTNIGSGVVGAPEIASTLVTAGSYNASNITVDADGRLTFAAQGQLTSLSDVSTSTKTAGNLLIANGTTFASVAISGDISITSAGVVTVSSASGTGPTVFANPVKTLDIVTVQGGFDLSGASSFTGKTDMIGSNEIAANAVGSSEIAATAVTAGSYNAANITVDADGRLIFAAQGQLTSLSDVSSSTKTAGNLLVANGTNFASVSMSGSCSLAASGAISCSGGSGSGASHLTGLSDVVDNGTASPYTAKNVIIANGTKFYAGALTLTGLSDVATATKTAGNLLVADGTNFASVAMSGSCTLSSAGVASCSGSSTVIPSQNDFRLSLSTGASSVTTDQTAKTTLYLTPHKGKHISTYDSSVWTDHEINELSLSLVGIVNAKNHDIFVASGATSLTNSVAWTAEDTRSENITTQDGVWVSASDASKRYVGTIRGSATGQTEDSNANRFVWNEDNRIERKSVNSQGGSHTYSTATTREWGGSTTGRINFLIGRIEEAVYIECSGRSSAASTGNSFIGVAINRANVSEISGQANYNTSGGFTIINSAVVFPVLGHNFVTCTEVEFSGSSITYDSDKRYLKINH